MQKQKKQFIVIVILLLIFLLAYGCLRIYNRNQEQKEKADAQNAKITVTDIAQEDMVSFSYEYEGEMISFVKEDGIWYAAADRTISVDQDKIVSMLAPVLALTAEEKLSSYEDLSDYGLAEPKNHITLKTNEETVELFVGDQNAMLGQYYVKKEGEDTVYLISTSLDTTFARGIEDLTATEELTEDRELQTE